MSQHWSDRQIRSTLLHELCHAAAEPCSRGHDIYFFLEVEKLLAAGAPIRMDFLNYECASDPDLIFLLPHCADIRKKQEARRPETLQSISLPPPEPPF